jgi:hypothetical protein
MYSLDDYVFVDEDFRVLEQVGLADDEIAEEWALRLSHSHHHAITCYRHVATIDAADDARLIPLDIPERSPR